MKLKNLITNNFELKLLALFLAFFVWVTISGKERSSTEKSFEVNVEHYNVTNNISISDIRPEKVRITVKGTTKLLEKITAADFKIRIDLKDVTEGTRYYFTENYLQIPEEIQNRGDLTIHHRMIEITVKEFMTREVNVRIRYKGRMKKGVALIDRRVVPDKVKIFGYKSQISSVNTVYGIHPIDLSTIEESGPISVPLEKTEEILRFVDDRKTVDVYIDVENKNKPDTENKTKVQNG